MHRELLIHRGNADLLIFTLHQNSFASNVLKARLYMQMQLRGHGTVKCLTALDHCHRNPNKSWRGIVFCCLLETSPLFFLRPVSLTWQRSSCRFVLLFGVGDSVTMSAFMLTASPNSTQCAHTLSTSVGSCFHSRAHQLPSLGWLTPQTQPGHRLAGYLSSQSHGDFHKPWRGGEVFAQIPGALFHRGLDPHSLSLCSSHS
jgi:hypothetical protein